MSDPSQPTADYRAMAEQWALPKALMGGTAAMRAAGPRFLPRHPAENAQVYAARSGQAVLRNYFRRNVQKITGRLFQNAIVPTADLPPRLGEYLQNIDLAGRGLNSFAKSWFEDALVSGISYALIDYPARRDIGSGGGQGAADQGRPYAVHIRAEDVIAAERDPDQLSPRLGQVRLRELVKEVSGFEEKLIEQIRVIHPDHWQIYRKNSKGNWALTAEGENTLGEIPIVPLYTNRTGYMRASPLLEDLAYLNLEHYQIRSDQRNALNVASFPILAASGYDAEIDGPIEVGPNKVLTTSDTGGRYYYVESTGAALEAGARELADLEKAIQLFGLQFEAGVAAETATGRRIDAADAMSPISAMVMELEDSLNGMLTLFAKWEGIECSAGLHLALEMEGDGSGGDESARRAEQRSSFNHQN